jgi:preprotein translocase subunit SecG
MFIALIILHVLVSVVLVLVVLLQSGRGAELGAAFGGIGQANLARTQPTFISRFTTGLAAVFMLTSLSLALIATERPSDSLLKPQAVPSAPAGAAVPSIPGGTGGSATPAAGAQTSEAGQPAGAAKPEPAAAPAAPVQMPAPAKP